jgi:hypothetical protein
MEFRIADTFVDSPARLTGDEQKAVKMTTFDLRHPEDVLGGVLIRPMSGAPCRLET